MSKKNKRRSLWDSLRRRYQFNVMNEETYEVKSVLAISILNIIIWTGIVLLLMGFLTYLTIAFTPLKQYIPGYGKIDEREMVLSQQFLVDSLEIRLEQNNLKLKIIEKILTGDFDTTGYTEDLFVGNYDSLNLFSDSKEDSILRSEVELRERFSIFDDEEAEAFSISNIAFFPPLKGMVSDSFNASTSHFGIDVIAGSNKEVKSVFYGTVILADFTVETGYVIGVQHSNDLVSIYKHNSKLNKKAGDVIKQGEVIAVAGNTGE
ncbi:MAG: M23 family metallopeptidase, partial [Bacteroidetes bacterium]|nr:M23 family metallopeptidase [Bacteroidota bacterium]